MILLYTKMSSFQEVGFHCIHSSTSTLNTVVFNLFRHSLDYV